MPKQDRWLNINDIYHRAERRSSLSRNRAPMNKTRVEYTSGEVTTGPEEGAIICGLLSVKELDFTKRHV